MAVPPLLTLADIHLRIGSTQLLAGAEFSVMPGDRLTLVGRNGSGKSTLMKIAAGIIEPDAGERFVQPGKTLRYLPQEPDLSAFATALDAAASGLAPTDDPYRPVRLLERLGVPADAAAGKLSGGEARRVALAMVMAPQPDILFLDEPTNHLDLPAIEWLETELASLRSAIVIVSHDRRFLQNLSRRTLWLDRGRTREMDKGFSAFEAWRDQIFAEEERELHKLDRKIASELDWLRYGVTARRTRNQGRLARLNEMRQQRRESKRALGALATVDAAISEAEQSGKAVIDAFGLSKSFGDRRIVDSFSIRIMRGDRIGIVGPNGAGKTTLLNLLTGGMGPDSGRLRLGSGIEMVTMDQRREVLKPKWTVAEALTGGRGDTVFVGGRGRHVVGYMKDFLFLPEQARQPVAVLSGGERGRMMLARAFAKPSNLMVLDEPTNDLDLETLDLLEELLGDYTGTAIIVSHDRDFLDRVVTGIIASEGSGRWAEYAGGYSDMLVQRGTTTAEPAKPNARPAKPDSGKGTPASTRPAGPQRKLSFKQKHALETLPGRIDELARRIAALEAKLADPALFARDQAAFARAATDLDAARAERETAETEWLELEMLREEIEG